jgi:hypothetical protein
VQLYRAWFPKGFIDAVGQALLEERQGVLVVTPPARA